MSNPVREWKPVIGSASIPAVSSLARRSPLHPPQLHNPKTLSTCAFDAHGADFPLNSLEKWSKSTKIVS